MRAWLALRDGVHYRREAFAAGLAAAGYTVEHRMTDKPGPNDILVCWNRYGEVDAVAKRFEARGRPVLVAENGYLGNEFAGARWYALARGQHNGAGSWPEGGADRWDALQVNLGTWRACGGEIVLLPQRGIGPPGVAMPRDWPERIGRKLTKAGIAFRVRRHPGTGTEVPLADDLANASAVVTWGSGAALKALALGVPVYHDLPCWIGARAALPVRALLLREPGKRNNEDRLEMFRRLAWAQWRLSEIADGTAFRGLLSPA